MNVPVGDAISIQGELIKNGIQNVELVIIPSADHSFQEVPEDIDLRYKERCPWRASKGPIFTHTSNCSRAS